MNAVMIRRGLIAGFLATVVLSALMLMKKTMGVMPELDPIGMISTMAGAKTPIIGWIGHFAIGTIFWGIGFAIVGRYLPGPYWARGVIFAVAAWLMMMVVVMPMAGARLFGLGLGAMVPLATLILHVIYGLVLGIVYGLLGSEKPVAGLR